jgi:hypothetical protein
LNIGYVNSITAKTLPDVTDSVQYKTAGIVVHEHDANLLTRTFVTINLPGAISELSAKMRSERGRGMKMSKFLLGENPKTQSLIN